jgi:hypothetical protein
MGTIISSDIPGSSLTIAFQNYERDAATRKFLVDSWSRADAIETVISDAAALNGTVNHPDEGALKADGITAQAVGPGRWVVTVQYLRRKYGAIPSTVTGLVNLRMAYEGIEVYCTPDEFVGGLPFGGNGKKFAYPGGNFSTDPRDPPKPWVYNRPVVNVQIPFSSTSFPDQALNNIGKINLNAAIDFGTFNAPTGTVRYDGAEMKATGPSYDFYVPSGAKIRYYGTYSYTFSPNGFYKQRVDYDDSLQEWYAENVPWGF